MTLVIVEGSKNGFQFGPVSIEIPDRLPTEEEANTVLDSVLQADDVDGIETSLTQTQRDERNKEESPKDRAVQNGFTVLSYRRPSGQAVQIV
jgi:hypothetical protein